MKEEQKIECFCAHLNISWKPVTRDGITTGRWVCNACETPFVTEHALTLAIAELARKDERIRELETKLEAIRGALMTDEQAQDMAYELERAEPDMDTSWIAKLVLEEQRTRIQNILSEAEAKK